MAGRPPSLARTPSKKVIGVNMTEEEVDAFDRIVAWNGYDSRSKFLNHNIKEMIEEYQKLGRI